MTETASIDIKHRYGDMVRLIVRPNGDLSIENTPFINGAWAVVKATDVYAFLHESLPEAKEREALQAAEARRWAEQRANDAHGRANRARIAELEAVARAEKAERERDEWRSRAIHAENKCTLWQEAELRAEIRTERDRAEKAEAALSEVTAERDRLWIRFVHISQIVAGHTDEGQAWHASLLPLAEESKDKAADAIVVRVRAKRDDLAQAERHSAALQERIDAMASDRAKANAHNTARIADLEKARDMYAADATAWREKYIKARDEMCEALTEEENERRAWCLRANEAERRLAACRDGRAADNKEQTEEIAALKAKCERLHEEVLAALDRAWSTMP